MSLNVPYGGGRSGSKSQQPSAVFGGGMNPGGGGGDKGLSMSVFQTFRLAWADDELRGRILFVLFIFAVYALGIHISVPIPGIRPEDLTKSLESNQFFQLMNIMGGGALKRLSIFSLGLNPYITASIILQIYAQASPKMKQEMKEGGEYARQQQNKRTRYLSIILCLAQGWGFLQMIMQGLQHPPTPFVIFTVLTFWTAGAMFVLWLGEQISERGIGNGVSLMIFAGIIIALPNTFGLLAQDVRNGIIAPWRIGILLVIFLVTTWFVVMFTVAQRKIPIQHMRRMQGTRVQGGQTSYLPLSVNMAGVIPIIFAISLIYIPIQISTWFKTSWPNFSNALVKLNDYINPGSQTATSWQVVIGCFAFTLLIFFFTYFYTAIQYNVDDIADNLKRGGSFIPGVRPGKQTSDFLNNVISRITVVGAAFLAIVSLIQFISPRMLEGGQMRISVIGGSTLLIMVSVALETMRQIEANLLMKQYNS